MRRVIDVKPSEGFRIGVRFDDKTSGYIDLHDLTGRGEFKV